MKSFWVKRSRNIFFGLVASSFVLGGSTMFAAGQAERFSAQDVDKEAVAQSNATAAATADATPRPQIDGIGTLNTANSTRSKPVQFTILGVANDQATPEFLFGEFCYVDRKAHISFSTGKIETVTINGNQGAFTGTARIGGPRNKRTVQFIVTVTANQNLPSQHFFSIVLSNGYAASGNLKNGEIVIHDVAPD